RMGRLKNCKHILNDACTLEKSFTEGRTCRWPCTTLGKRLLMSTTTFAWNVVRLEAPVVRPTVNSCNLARQRNQTLVAKSPNTISGWKWYAPSPDPPRSTGSMNSAQKIARFGTYSA